MDREKQEKTWKSGGDIRSGEENQPSDNGDQSEGVTKHC
jgi:hypothetical protein